ncbi:MarR family winged helix-turn-helix transcriptional regulator [Deinococcus altitudinis]|uniref:MarR family winged helix-turn-helix transcriptional regulator n=1 Tax=Deinococcus altitudinis TaxID=468914 RepID=UPI003891D8A3
MNPTLQEELKQRQPFKSLQEEAGLNLGRTLALLGEEMERLLRPYGVSAPQYNVLRILRGAGAEGLGRNEIRDRMVSRMPDVTRMLARLEEAGLICRQQSGTDRRYFPTRLTEQGLKIVDSLDGPIQQGQQRHFAGLTPEQLGNLISTLTQIRANARQQPD